MSCLMFEEMRYWGGFTEALVCLAVEERERSGTVGKNGDWFGWETGYVRRLEYIEANGNQVSY